LPGITVVAAPDDLEEEWIHDGTSVAAFLLYEQVEKGKPIVM
jgi:hypothetical protein